MTTGPQHAHQIFLLRFANFVSFLSFLDFLASKSASWCRRARRAFFTETAVCRKPCDCAQRGEGAHTRHDRVVWQTRRAHRRRLVCALNLCIRSDVAIAFICSSLECFRRNVRQHTLLCHSPASYTPHTRIWRVWCCSCCVWSFNTVIWSGAPVNMLVVQDG